MFKKFWEWKRKLFAGMELRLDVAIDKLDNLSKDVELNKMKKHVLEKVDGEVITQGVDQIIAGNMEFQYGSEAFKLFQKQQGKKEVSGQIVDLVPKNDTMKR